MTEVPYHQTTNQLDQMYRLVYDVGLPDCLTLLITPDSRHTLLIIVHDTQQRYTT